MRAWLGWLMPVPHMHLCTRSQAAVQASWKCPERAAQCLLHRLIRQLQRAQALRQRHRAERLVRAAERLALHGSGQGFWCKLHTCQTRLQLDLISRACAGVVSTAHDADACATGDGAAAVPGARGW